MPKRGRTHWLVTNFVNRVGAQLPFGTTSVTFRSDPQILRRRDVGTLGDVIVSAAGFVADALVSVLTSTFFLILGGEHYLNAGVKHFPESHRPLVRRQLTQSAGEGI